MALRPLSIGNLRLASNVVMAPMVGLTSRAYRILAIRRGCALAAAEMLAAESLVRSRDPMHAVPQAFPGERPFAMQIVGARPEAMAEAAMMLQDAGADIVDINMGCPARRIVRGGGGVALMEDTALAARIVCAVRRRVSIPVTVKLRAGSSGNEVLFARALEDAGADGLAVHGRPAQARHRGPASPEAICRVVEAVRIPVIGNGGIQTPEQGAAMHVETGCAGIMIGRAAMGDATLFARTADHLRGGGQTSPPSDAERAGMLAEHLRLLVEDCGETVAVIKFRKCLPHYLRGVRGARKARQDLLGFTVSEDVIRGAMDLLCGSMG